MRVLIIDDVHEVLQIGLEKLGFEVSYQPLMQRSELLQCIVGYEGLVVRTKTAIDATVLSHGVNLKWIGRAGAGLDNIDTHYCDEHNINYFNAGEANADAVGEHTLAMLLSLSTNLQKADKEVRQGIWDRKGNIGWELKGKTVGIIGFGNTGKAVAKKLSGFDVKVLAYDKYLTNYGNQYAQEATMGTIFNEADIVTLHVPLTAETKQMVNANWIAKFNKPIVLLNLARGGVVNLQEATLALKNGKVKAAGFDVLENEQISNLSDDEKKTFNQLVKMSNIVLSPHVAGWTIESYRKIGEVLLQKIKQLTLA
jgi:D-3-phosphoglycerate dehydrogenase / 2-oxoglutarate reductase